VCAPGAAAYKHLKLDNTVSRNDLKNESNINKMGAVLSFCLFLIGMAFCVALIGRICKEGDYDDFD